MNEPDTQFSRSQLCGILLLGICSWTIIIGIIWALVKDFIDGVIATLAGAIGTGVILKWLTYINKGSQ